MDALGRRWGLKFRTPVSRDRRRKVETAVARRAAAGARAVGRVNKKSCSQRDTWCHAPPGERRRFTSGFVFFFSGTRSPAKQIPVAVRERGSTHSAYGASCVFIPDRSCARPSGPFGCTTVATATDAADVGSFDGILSK
ncbi:hypothetical protein EVAR_81574_1 [Eumeta japonica]|uniref:Uncharacterized protein n=1 Tax=Eumeta variegata TaxID=151549 RepID=A0A4C1UZA6_EUMVA|nr:hypothetical protein EVAR_81574_1 [Eumeta japonica]